MKRLLILILAAALAFTSCIVRKEPPPKPAKPISGGLPMLITLTSSAFEEGGMIPALYTCDGSNISPPLAWSGVPAGTNSLVLIADDPDAPMGTWVHWVLFNLHPNTKMLAAGVPGDEKLENGARHGRTDFGKYGYGGPCPPSGTHRYYFKIYALDKMFDITGPIIKEDLLKIMEGHILGQGQLMGRYTKR